MIKHNYDNNDGRWPTPIGLAKSLSAQGKYSEALKYAKQGLEIEPNIGYKDYIEGMISKLQDGIDIN